MSTLDELVELLRDKPLPKVVDQIKKQSGGSYEAEKKEIETKLKDDSLPDSVRNGYLDVLAGYEESDADAVLQQLGQISAAFDKLSAELGITVPKKRGRKPGRKPGRKRTGPIHNGRTKDKVLEAIADGSTTRKQVAKFTGWTATDTDFRIQRMLDNGQIKEKSGKLSVV